jgi:hypothetical protein
MQLPYWRNGGNGNKNLKGTRNPLFKRRYKERPLLNNNEELVRFGKPVSAALNMKF